MLQIPGAWLALKIGGTRVFGYGVLLSSLLAILTPVAARYHVMALIGVRIFQGLFLVRFNVTQYSFLTRPCASSQNLYSSEDICYLINRGRFPCFHSLIETRGRVGRIRDSYTNPRRSRRFA